MGDTPAHLIAYIGALVAFIFLYRQLLGRHQTKSDPALSHTAEASGGRRKALATEERMLAISEETLALQRETMDMLRRLLEKL